MSSLVLLKRVFAMTSVFSWQILLVFALLNSVFQGKICLLFQVFLDFLLLHKVKMKVKSLSHVRLFVTPWTGGHMMYSAYKVNNQGDSI